MTEQVLINAAFLVSVFTIGLCSFFFWIHPKFDDCLGGRLGLIMSIGAVLVITASIKGDYKYSNILPEVALLLSGQAVYMGWLVWRFVRKRFRIRRGIEADSYSH